MNIHHSEAGMITTTIKKFKKIIIFHNSLYNMNNLEGKKWAFSYFIQSFIITKLPYIYVDLKYTFI